MEREVVVISVWLLIECKQISRQTVREPNGSYSDRPYMYKEASLPLSYTQQLDKSAYGTSGTMRGTWQEDKNEYTLDPSERAADRSVPDMWANVLAVLTPNKVNYVI